MGQGNAVRDLISAFDGYVVGTEHHLLIFSPWNISLVRHVGPLRCSRGLETSFEGIGIVRVARRMFATQRDVVHRHICTGRVAQEITQYGDRSFGSSCNAESGRVGSAPTEGNG